MITFNQFKAEPEIGPHYHKTRGEERGIDRETAYANLCKYCIQTHIQYTDSTSCIHHEAGTRQIANTIRQSGGLFHFSPSPPSLLLDFTFIPPLPPPQPAFIAFIAFIAATSSSSSASSFLNSFS